MKYRVLKDIAISDAAFEAFGKTEKELFENAALAVFEEMAETKKLQNKTRKEFLVKAENLELLLYNFLSEMVALKDEKGIVFGKIRVIVKKEKKGWKATTTVWGDKVEKLNEKIIRRDVKAVTFHLFKVEKTKQGWKATVVLDI